MLTFDTDKEWESSEQIGIPTHKVDCGSPETKAFEEEWERQYIPMENLKAWLWKKIPISLHWPENSRVHRTVWYMLASGN